MELLPVERRPQRRQRRHARVVLGRGDLEPEAVAVRTGLADLPFTLRNKKWYNAANVKSIFDKVVRPWCMLRVRARA